MPQSKNQNGDPCHLLVIDDDPGITKLFIDLFAEFDIEIEAVQSGLEGINRICSQRYDLIFLDVKLDDINGINVLKLIKSHQPSTAIIMISAFINDEMIQDFKEYSAEAYLKKPLSIIDIITLTVKLTKSEYLAEKIRGI